MIANKIKEIIEQRKKSVEKEIHFGIDLDGKLSNHGRKSLSNFMMELFRLQSSSQSTSTTFFFFSSSFSLSDL